MNTYKAKGREVVIFVKAYGKVRPIRFRDQGAYLRTSIISVTDPVLANAIESHPQYGSLFFKESGDLQKVETPAGDVHVFNKVYSHVKRTQLAIEVLVKEYGVKRTDIPRKEDVIRKACELNISFPNL